MDTPETTCLEFCFGYGGIHLGLKRVVRNLRCIAASEIEGYAVANMVSKIEAGFMEPFPVWTNLKTFPCEQFRDLVDIFCAGYPCQPFSTAGRRQGEDDPRHLWPFVRRAVEIIRPRYCFFENVEGHVSKGLREVLTELVMLGYRVENSRGEPTWGIFSAAEEGAPHGRKRVFILAAREGVVMDDALCEQDQWNDSRGFPSSIVRTSELADTDGNSGAIVKQQREECAEELSGSVELENSEGRRARPVSTRPGNERIGATKPDGASEVVANCASGRRAERDTNSEGLRTGKTAQKKRKRFDNGDQVGDGLAVAKESRLEGERIRGQSSECGESKRENILRRVQKEKDGTRLDDLQKLRNEFVCDDKRGIAKPIFWPNFPTRPGEAQHDWEPRRVISVKRGLGGGVNGRAANVDRLRLLGNGVYPASAAKAFVTLYNRFKE